MGLAGFSKMRKYNKMKNRLPKEVLPDTRTFNRGTFNGMLAHYQHIVLKPDNGRKGRGVVKIVTLRSGRYEVHFKKRKMVITGHHNLSQLVKKITSSKRYVIQQYIPLARIKGRPIDFRVIVQRYRGQQDWKVTGQVAKVAGSGYFITNVRPTNGRVLTLKNGIEHSTITKSPKVITPRLHEIARKSAQVLGEGFPSLNIIGFDVAIDNSGKVWVLEANFDPGLSHFRKLKDKSMLKMITAYKNVNKKLARRSKINTKRIARAHRKLRRSHR